MSDNEQMNETREAIADVLAKMEQESIIHVYIPATDLEKYVKRIKAAWKHEREKVESDALAVGGIVESARTAEKSSAVGNAAAIRKALEKLDKLLFVGVDGYVHGQPDKTDEIERTIKSILSAPVRNCDMFRTKDDARAYFDNIVCQRSNGSGSIECKGCPLDRIDNPHRADCREEWLFSTASERKGEDNA